ncbi:hypothetical protein BO94DRAFT_551790 [Aspergillus sclerotioniger CBS 115572]|uniref:Uncharacterized protein n=1 Tax=Aspergillus sclerotioniger CBS 115572 TaxID=1450535 RepID=A0A317USK1_9EURO|nr:hypothetical protein BO94DRAFT_551790 [Aspergillus sclerotioniger CBS 115572]PWY64974.1 hypothetical protein BO94DRAFT_551790 [Aspergillus sclerotioniger CBS 115572]
MPVHNMDPYPRCHHERQRAEIITFRPCRTLQLAPSEIVLARVLGTIKELGFWRQGEMRKFALDVSSSSYSADCQTPYKVGQFPRGNDLLSTKSGFSKGKAEALLSILYSTVLLSENITALWYAGLVAATPTPEPSISYIDKYEGCDQAQVQRLEKAFNDVHTLTTTAESIDISKHPGLQEDEKYVKAMWKAIASPNFKITEQLIYLSNVFKETTKDSRNDLSSRHMHPPENRRPSRKPSDRKEYWCEADKHIKWYEVAAQHLLHEMTHLDAAGKQAGYPEVRQVLLLIECY